MDRLASGHCHSSARAAPGTSGSLINQHIQLTIVVDKPRHDVAVRWGSSRKRRLAGATIDLPHDVSVATSGEIGGGLGRRHALKVHSSQRLAWVLNAGVPAHIGANHECSSNRDSGDDENEQHRRTQRERQTVAPSDANRRRLERGGAALNGGKSILQVKIGVHRELPFLC
jgi:hypothetical protein